MYASASILLIFMTLQVPVLFATFWHGTTVRGCISGRYGRYENWPSAHDWEELFALLTGKYFQGDGGWGWKSPGLGSGGYSFTGSNFGSSFSSGFSGGNSIGGSEGYFSSPASQSGSDNSLGSGNPGISSIVDTEKMKQALNAYFAKNKQKPIESSKPINIKPIGSFGGNNGNDHGAPAGFGFPPHIIDSTSPYDGKDHGIPGYSPHVIESHHPHDDLTNVYGPPYDYASGAWPGTTRRPQLRPDGPGFHNSLSLDGPASGGPSYSLDHDSPSPGPPSPPDTGPANDFGPPYDHGPAHDSGPPRGPPKEFKNSFLRDHPLNDFNGSPVGPPSPVEHHHDDSPAPPPPSYGSFGPPSSQQDNKDGKFQSDYETFGGYFNKKRRQGRRRISTVQSRVGQSPKPKILRRRKGLRWRPRPRPRLRPRPRPRSPLNPALRAQRNQKLYDRHQKISRRKLNTSFGGYKVDHNRLRNG